MSDVNLGSFVEGLNYALDQMVSAKGKKLKVQNPEEYFFEPKEITGELVTCYSFMGNYQKFVDRVVVDPRSYKEQNFVRVVRLIKSNKIKVPFDIAQQFENFTNK